VPFVTRPLRRRLSRFLRPDRTNRRRTPQGPPRQRSGPPYPEIPEGWAIGPPDFIGIGVQKAGTTWWWTLLRAHPDMVGTVKETHQLTRLGWRPMFEEDVRSYHRYFPRRDGTVTGEWTPRYMTVPGVVDNIRACAPDARILAILRDPVERYRSGVGQWQKRKERLGKRLNLAAGRKDAYARSFYGFMLQRYVEAFGRDRVLILQFERCKADPAGEYLRTLRFLGLREWLPPENVLGKRVNVSRIKLTPKALDEPPDLVERLAEDVRLLRSFAPDFDLSLWPNFAPTPIADTERAPDETRSPERDEVPG
jgi:Sulfotransferase family